MTFHRVYGQIPQNQIKYTRYFTTGTTFANQQVVAVMREVFRKKNLQREVTNWIAIKCNIQSNAGENIVVSFYSTRDVLRTNDDVNFPSGVLLWVVCGNDHGLRNRYAIRLFAENRIQLADNIFYIRM